MGFSPSLWGFCDVSAWDTPSASLSQHSLKVNHSDEFPLPPAIVREQDHKPRGRAATPTLPNPRPSLLFLALRCSSFSFLGFQDKIHLLSFVPVCGPDSASLGTGRGDADTQVKRESVSGSENRVRILTPPLTTVSCQGL